MGTNYALAIKQFYITYLLYLLDTTIISLPHKGVALGKLLLSTQINSSQSVNNVSFRRLLVSCILFGITIIVIGTIIAFRFYDNDINAKRRELVAIGSLKANQIVALRNDFLHDAIIVSKTNFLNDLLIHINAHPHDYRFRLALHKMLEVFPENGDWEEVAVYDASGRRLDNIDPKNDEFLDNDSMLFEMAAFSSGTPQFRDLYAHSNGTYSIDVIVPIVDNIKRLFAALIFRYDPTKLLFPLIQRWPVPSETSETLLVRKEGGNVVWLNTLRFSDKSPLTIKISLTEKNIPAVAAVLGQFGAFYGTDYRGVKVLADLRPIENSPWFLVAKIDASEATILAREHFLLIIIVSITIAALVISLFFSKYHKILGNNFQSLYRYEKKQTETLEEFHATLLGIGDGVISTDKNGYVRWMNKSAEQLTGWSNHEAKGIELERVFKIFSQETGEELENPIKKVIQSDGIIRLPKLVTLRSRNGVEHTIMDSGAPIHASDGFTGGVVLVFHDVSLEQKAEARANWLSTIVELSLNEVIIFHPRTLHIVYANKIALDNLGYSLDELRAMTPLEIKPELSRNYLLSLLRPLRADQHCSATIVTKNRRKDGSTYEVFLSFQFLDSPDGPRYVSVGLDFSEQRILENRLRDSIVERETLLREIHHRTKNNLQIVSSLISLEYSNWADQTLRSVLLDIEGRVDTMAIAHEFLYQSASLSKIELGPYMQSIFALAIQSRNMNSNIRTIVECNEIETTLDFASPIGLAINELTTNSMKYAFPDGRSGLIQLTVNWSENHIIFDYRDNGVGLPEDFVQTKQGHLGFVLIDSLISKQLHGQFSILKDRGFHCIFDIIMPLGIAA